MMPHYSEERRFMSRIIIGLIGVAGSGKTLVARRIENRGFTRMRFAGPMKEMLRVGLRLTDEQLDGDQKMVPIAEFGGHTPRTLMQTLGTAWGRNIVGPDLWIRAWERHAAMVQGPIVVDDVRFPNEARAVRNAGGVLWRVYRPGLTTMDHISERLQAEIQDDVLLNNATTLDDLDISVDAALASLLEGQQQ
jgi:hypothetical protein